MEKNNSTWESADSDTRDEYLAKWEIATLAIILIVTLFGNTLVLFSLYLKRHRGRRKKFTRMHFFIMHLSIADFLTGLLNVLPQLIWDIAFRFPGGPITCKIVKFGQPLGSYLSSYVLTATAIDRYHAICHPLSYCSITSRRSRIMVYCAWVVALLLCLPQIFIFSYQEIIPKVWDCWATFGITHGERIYVTWYGVTVFLLPFVVLIYTYTGICIGVWKSNKVSNVVIGKITSEAVDFIDRHRNPLVSKAMINTLKQTIAVISLYAITSTPFIGCQLWATWYPGATSSSFFTGGTFTILALLSSLTSCVNPWIYLSFNHELRATLMEYFCLKSDYAFSDDHDANRSHSHDISTRSSLISRISRYAGTMIFDHRRTHIGTLPT